MCEAIIAIHRIQDLCNCIRAYYTALLPGALLIGDANHTYRTPNIECNTHAKPTRLTTVRAVEIERQHVDSNQ